MHCTAVTFSLLILFIPVAICISPSHVPQTTVAPHTLCLHMMLSLRFPRPKPECSYFMHSLPTNTNLTFFGANMYNCLPVAPPAAANSNIYLPKP